MLTSALEHYRRQQRITAAGLVAARRVERRGPLAVAQVVTAFQMLAARDAAESVAPMLEEQGIDATAAGEVVVASLAGVASDGRPLDTLFEQAGNAYTFGLMVTTQLQDAARSAASVAIAVRASAGGYVRMLNTPSCSRCVILAGKWFRWNAGFDRHPKCDCRHVPSREDRAGDLRTDPKGYFDSLPTAAELDARYPDLTVKMRNETGLYSQEDIFTRAGAQAIRDGADIRQVVNARRGMRKAQVFGREAFITTEGTTRRGIAFEALARRGTVRNAEELATRNTRTGPELRRVHRERARSPRVMPETIYELAGDNRDEAIRLLKAHGYIHRYQ